MYSSTQIIKSCWTCCETLSATKLPKPVFPHPPGRKNARPINVNSWKISTFPAQHPFSWCQSSFPSLTSAAASDHYHARSQSWHANSHWLKTHSTNHPPFLRSTFWKQVIDHRTTAYLVVHNLQRFKRSPPGLIYGSTFNGRAERTRFFANWKFANSQIEIDWSGWVWSWLRSWGVTSRLEGGC